jgi:ribosomal protein S18 acetylase RimI-like enzyme
MPFEILPATWHDLNGLRQIEKACFSEDAWPLLDLIAVLTMPKIIRLKAVVEMHMVGFVAGDEGGDDDLAWITTIGVLPDYQHVGIASALLEACEARFTRPRLRLCVRPANRVARNLYYKFGYHDVTIWHNYYHQGADALVLEKDNPNAK